MEYPSYLIIHFFLLVYQKTAAVTFYFLARRRQPVSGPDPDVAVCQRFWLGNVLNAIFGSPALVCLCIRARALKTAMRTDGRQVGERKKWGGESKTLLLAGVSVCICCWCLPPSSFLAPLPSFWLWPVPHCKRIWPEMISTPGLKCVHVATASCCYPCCSCCRCSCRVES